METTQPTPSAPPTPTQAPASHAMGPLIGTLIILIVLALGGLYAWNMQASMPENEPLPLILSDDDREGLPPTSSSDEVTDIEADISATDLDAFEAQIDADLKAAESAF